MPSNCEIGIIKPFILKNSVRKMEVSCRFDSGKCGVLDINHQNLIYPAQGSQVNILENTAVTLER